VRHLVLSQCTRVTDGQTDGQNYDSQHRPRICSRGNDVTFSRPDFHVIHICVMLCSSTSLVRPLALGIGLPVDGGSQYRYRGGQN